MDIFRSRKDTPDGTAESQAWLPSDDEFQTLPQRLKASSDSADTQDYTFGEAPAGTTNSVSPQQLPAMPAPALDGGALRQRITDAGISDLFDIRLITKLVKDLKLDPTRIEEFVGEAKKRHQDIAGYAVAMRVADEADLTAVTAELFGMEPVSLTKQNIEENLALLIKPEQASLWRVIPYSRDELGALLIATSNPRDTNTREEVQRALPREAIKWTHAPESELNLAIDRVYNDAASTAQMQTQMKRLSADTLDERITVRDSSLDSGVIKLVDTIIQKAEREDASDIHIEPKERWTEIRFRVDGIMRKAMEDLPQGDTTRQVVARIKMLAAMKTDERRKPQDGRVTINLGHKALDLRVVTVPTIYGEQVTMRLLDQTRATRSLEELGMTPGNMARYEAAINLPYGCALITGPTSSGKSTTLYSSAVRVVTPARKFISIEDPVEYRLGGITQIDVSGHTGMNFASALKAILRSDPDIIMVGEIRDAETAETAVNAALTGHFLYSTLHTNDALGSISRLEQLDIEPFLIAESVAVLVAQRLIRVLCPDCKVPYQIDTDYLRGLRAPQWAIDKSEEQGGVLNLYKAHPGGCNLCHGQGYRGRTGVHEVVTMNEELKRAIVARKPYEELVALVRGQGMHSLRDDAFIKIAAGMSSTEELARVVL